MPEQFPTHNPDTEIPPEMEGNSYYHLLVSEEQEADLSILTASHEAEPDARIAELFAPRYTRDENRSQEGRGEDQTNFYYRLLSDEVSNEEIAARRETERKSVENPKYIPEPTVDSKLQAFKRLQEARNADPIIEAIVDKYSTPSPGIPDYEAVISEVRTNPALRYELGSYLLRDKLPKIQRESPHAFPHRIVVNTQKNTSHPGYRHLGYTTSREFATMLALSMLDGTFIDPGDSEPIEIDKEKPENTQGQHRIAASILLGYDPKTMLA